MNAPFNLQNDQIDAETSRCEGDAMPPSRRVAAQDPRGEDRPNAYSLGVHSAAQRLGVYLGVSTSASHHT
jgi:hypothetical protein